VPLTFSAATPCRAICLCACHSLGFLLDWTWDSRVTWILVDWIAGFGLHVGTGQIQVWYRFEHIGLSAFLIWFPSWLRTWTFHSRQNADLHSEYIVPWYTWPVLIDMTSDTVFCYFRWVHSIHFSLSWWPSSYHLLMKASAIPRWLSALKNLIDDRPTVDDPLLWPHYWVACSWRENLGGGSSHLHSLSQLHLKPCSVHDLPVQRHTVDCLDITHWLPVHSTKFRYTIPFDYRWLHMIHSTNFDSILKNHSMMIHSFVLLMPFSMPRRPLTFYSTFMNVYLHDSWYSLLIPRILFILEPNSWYYRQTDDSTLLFVVISTFIHFLPTLCWFERCIDALWCLLIHLFLRWPVTWYNSLTRYWPPFHSLTDPFYLTFCWLLLMITTCLETAVTDQGETRYILLIYNSF